MNPTANPLGAGGDVTKAAVKIGELLRPPEPQGQPEQENATVQANPTVEEPESTGQPRDPETKRFVKAEPQADEQPEAEQAEGEAEQTEAKTDDTEELAEDVEDLAKQLGLEPDNLLEHLKAKVKVNGEEKRVNLKELLSGFSMESDYRQKTAKIAEERRQAEAERQQYIQQREQLSNGLSPLIQQLESLVTEDDQQLNQLLNDGDILEYERAKVRSELRRQQLSTAKQEQQRIERERAQEAHAAKEQEVIAHENRLIDVHPEWAKDIERGKRELGAIREYLKADGVPANDVDSLYNSHIILMAEKAMKYDKLVKETQSKVAKAKDAPLKFQKPGAAKAVEDPSKQAIRVSLQRLRKTGKPDDAARAIKALGLV